MDNKEPLRSPGAFINSVSFEDLLQVSLDVFEVIWIAEPAEKTKKKIRRHPNSKRIREPHPTIPFSALSLLSKLSYQAW